MRIPSVPFRSIPLVLAAALVPSLQAQQTYSWDRGVWGVLMAQGSLSSLDPSLKQWRWWLDAQDRQENDARRLDQFLLRPGLGYKLTDQITAWAGYAFVYNDFARREPFDENRFWQQTTWVVPTESFTFQWRNRLEERFTTHEDEVGWRLREMVKVTVPLTDDKKVFLSFWDEMFIELNQTSSTQVRNPGLQRRGFRQNRAFAGLGFALDDKRQMNVEVGYLNQWIDLNSNPTERQNHILSLSLILNF